MPGFMRRYAVPLDQATAWESAPERKRVIKTHFNWDLVPYSPDARYIAVIRDPKDVFVSSYFSGTASTVAAMPGVDTWYRAYLSKNFMMGGSWGVNAAGYWAQRHRPNVLVVSFKSMKKDLRATVRRSLNSSVLPHRGADRRCLSTLDLRAHEEHRSQVQHGK